MNARLTTEKVRLGYHKRVVIDRLDLTIPDGKVSVLIGPNGSGKSTAVKSLARLLRPTAGSVLLDGTSIQRMSTKEVARRMAILPQVLHSPDGITVEELVWYGRHPHRGMTGGPTTADRGAVQWALDVTQTTELRHAYVDELSGGQRQRAWIAVSLAQQTDLLLLDEPTTYLDLTYQLELLDLLRDLNRRDGKTIVMVLHDFNLAAEYADRIFVMQRGTLVSEGDPHEVLCAEVMRDVFDIKVAVSAHPDSGRPLIIPLGRSSHHESAVGHKPAR